jgi:hypothetical protein
MGNHSRRFAREQDVICTAMGCAADVDPSYYPSMTCQYHAEQVFRVVKANRDFIVEGMLNQHTPTEAEAAQADLKERRQAQSVVYYIRFGQGIKIGTTTNMQQRLSTFCLRDTDVLATEPGSHSLERSRHEFFADTRVGNTEVFTISPKLIKHIEAVKKYHGEPNITGYLSLRYAKAW